MELIAKLSIFFGFTAVAIYFIVVVVVIVLDTVRSVRNSNNRK